MAKYRNGYSDNLKNKDLKLSTKPGTVQYDIKYHVVWITKYRYKVITPEIGKRLKELRSSRILQDEYPKLRKQYWGQHLWGRGYFCATSGVVTEEMVKEYIRGGYK